MDSRGLVVPDGGFEDDGDVVDVAVDSQSVELGIMASSLDKEDSISLGLWWTWPSPLPRQRGISIIQLLLLKFK